MQKRKSAKSAKWQNCGDNALRYHVAEWHLVSLRSLTFLLPKKVCTITQTGTIHSEYAQLHKIFCTCLRSSRCWSWWTWLKTFLKDTQHFPLHSIVHLPPFSKTHLSIFSCRDTHSIIALNCSALGCHMHCIIFDAHSHKFDKLFWFFT